MDLLQADLVLTNGDVWLSNGSRSSGPVAVAKGDVLAVGPAAVEYLDDAAQVIDLAGGILLPGFGDGHAHPLIAALEPELAPVRNGRTVAEVVSIIGKYAREHPECAWIYGEGFPLTLAEGGRFYASWLDEVVPDRPVALRANDIHTVWCNTEALRVSGLLAVDEDPVDGWIDRSPSGVASGTLREWGAFGPVLALVPQLSGQSRAKGLVHASDVMAAAGITWVQDAWVDMADLPSYVSAADSLAVRMNLALRADPHIWRTQVQEFARARASLAASQHGSALTARTVKFFLDGIIESGTAAMLEPYRDSSGCCGLPNWTLEEFAPAVAAFDRAGFQVHIHAMGDWAVRAALDAIEKASTTNGPRDRRPVLTHLQVIDPVDMPRLAALGVTATFQPLWAQHDQLMADLTIPRLGAARAARQYPMRSVLASGANLSLGSDWPITRLEPLHGIAVATTRQTPDGFPQGGWIPEERLSVTEAVTAYTAGTAYQAFEDTRWGAIAAGMRADLVWLADDPAATPAYEIGSIPVLGTWLGGRRTHDGTSGVKHGSHTLKGVRCSPGQT